MKNYILSICLLVVVIAPSQAQEEWTLKQCIDYAIEHNIDVRRQVLEKQNRELNLNTTRWERLPDLSASMGQNFYFGRGPGRDGTYQDQTQASSSFGINTNIPVFSGLRIWNQVEVRKLDLQASIEDLDKAKEDLALNVTSFYLQILLNKELWMIAQEQVKLSMEQVKKTEVLVTNGKNPESELYESKASLANDETTLTQATNTLKLSLLDLNQLLNLDSLEGFDIVVPDMAEVVIQETANLRTPVDVFTYSVNNRPMVKAAEYKLQSSIRNLKVAKADFYPRISLGASYSNSYYHTYNLDVGSSNASFTNQLNRNGSESVGLNLSIPIFNRMATRNQVRYARIAVEDQQLALDKSKQTLYKEIQQAYYNAVAAHDKFRSSGKSVEASQLAFKYEEQKYSAGKSTSFQFNDAKVRLVKSLSEQIRAKYDFIFRSKILDFYNGQLLY